MSLKNESKILTTGTCSSEYREYEGAVLCACLCVCVCSVCKCAKLGRSLKEEKLAHRVKGRHFLSKGWRTQGACCRDRWACCRDRVAGQKGRRGDGVRLREGSGQTSLCQPCSYCWGFPTIPQGLRSRIYDCFFKTGYI